MPNFSNIYYLLRQLFTKTVFCKKTKTISSIKHRTYESLKSSNLFKLSVFIQSSATDNGNVVNKDVDLPQQQKLTLKAVSNEDNLFPIYLQAIPGKIIIAYI